MSASLSGSGQTQEANLIMQGNTGGNSTNYTWADQVGGSGTWCISTENCECSGLENWPASFWPLLAGGTQTFLGCCNPGLQNNIGPPLILLEHCDVNIPTNSNSGPAQTYSSEAQTTMQFNTGGKGVPSLLIPYLFTASATGASSATPIVTQTILISTLGNLSANSNVSAGLPNNVQVDTTPTAPSSDYTYSFAPVGPESALGYVTVVSGATFIANSDWAVVQTNGDVVVKAVVADTNDIPSLQWICTVGQKASFNPLEYLVPANQSATITVTAKLFSAEQSLNIWVIWAKLKIETSGTNTSPLLFGNRYDGTELLGIRSYANGNAVAGKMCGIATITPPGIHSIITNGWDFFQYKGTETFTNGTLYPPWSFPPWTYDGPRYTNVNKTVVPDANDALYTIDAPNIVAGAFGATNSLDTYKNLYDFITWNSTICCDTNNFWYFEGRWNRNQSPPSYSTNVGGGTINLP